MDKRELANKILALEGLSNDEKSALLGLLHEQKKYGLVWEDKPEDVELQMARELPVLTEVKERAIISEAPEAPNHILIEGDNLHALTALTYTHAGKIDVIYIDPPYNTGNKDFVYNDSFVEKEDSYRHSKWLSFMSRRLEMVKQLLTEEGVVFTSIDDNEQAQLKMLCDEVFGENNLLGIITWESTTQPINAGSAKYQLQQKCEYILCYAKNKNNKHTFLLKTFNKEAKYPHKGKYGACRFEIIEKSDAGQYKRDSMKFKILGQSPRVGKRWQIGEELARKLERQGRFEIVDGIVKRAVYPSDEQNGDSYIPFWSHLTASDVGTALNGKDELNTIMGKALGFDTVKPIRLIIEILSHFANNVTILDFFAGSGTTLHATMQLNATDGGHRQCILVTNNENNICEEITYVRNRRVIQGYTTPKGEKIEGLHSNTLRYYRTDFVPRVRTIANMRALTNAATDLLCIKNNVYQEVGAFGGRKIPAKIARYFDDGKTKMLVIYAEVYVPNFVEMLRNMAVEGRILVYVFSNSNYAYDDDFEEVLDKVELCALPDAIYKAYKKVLRPVKAVQGTDEAADVGEEDAQ